MIDFLKNFFSGEKSPEEQALAAAQKAPERDIMVIDAYAMDEDEEEEDNFGSCGSGCGGCGCRS